MIIFELDEGKVEIERTFEIWSVQRKSTDGEVDEMAYEDEDSARLDQNFFGGQLWVRTAYVEKGHPVEAGPVEDLEV